MGVFVSFLSPILCGLKPHARKALNVGVTLVCDTLLFTFNNETKSDSQDYNAG